MIQNGSQIDGCASLEHGSLNMQATDKATTAEMLFPTGLEQESLGQRLGLWGLAYPYELEDETRCNRVPLFIDERKVDLVPQGIQIVEITVRDRRKVDERKFLGAVEGIRSHGGDLTENKFPNFLGDM